jgi:hypothetical protein
MKISISRPTIYLLILSFLLLLFVVLFSFLVLIPEGKDYRKTRLEIRQQSLDLQSFKEYHDETFQHLKKIQSQNKQVIIAFDTTFSTEKFTKLYRTYFSSLKISPQQKLKDDGAFTTYEVNTTSEIRSPKSFYDFLEALNKSNWIIGVDFPINFKRDGEMIQSSFTMKVYNDAKDINNSK